jgi:hypothetical protein
VEFPEARLGPDGLLLVPSAAQVEEVEPDPGSIIPVVEDLKAKGFDVPFSILLFPKHEIQHRRLFERHPELGDINQRQMGDCWFLAALAAIVALGTGNAIKLMMCGIGDYAYVRLWDRAQMPHFVRVHKGLIAVRGRATLHSAVSTEGGLSTAVLEKAMTAIDKEGRFDPRKAVYGHLEGGLSHLAFQALLGVEAERTPIQETEYHYDQEGTDFKDLRKILKGDHNNSPSMQIKTDLFGGLVGQNKVNLFYDQVWEPWVDAVGLYGLWMRSFANFTQGRVYRLEDFERYMREFARNPLNGMSWTTHSFAFNSAAFDVDFAPFRANPFNVPMPSPRRQTPTELEAVEQVCRWVRQKRIFSGRRGTGLYTDPQVRLYNDIEQHLQALRPVCLGTPELVGTPDATLGSSGEKKSKGLAGSHSYAVTGCHRDAATGVRFVQVFNPWGIIGRGYTFAPGALQLPPTQAAIDRRLKGAAKGEPPEHAFETARPLFWLELADLTKRCANIYTCKTASGTPKVIKAGRQLSRLK